MQNLDGSAQKEIPQEILNLCSKNFKFWIFPWNGNASYWSSLLKTSVTMRINTSCRENN